MITASLLAASLAKLNIEGATYVPDAASGQMVFDVKNAHALTQAAGYLKFIGGPRKKAIFFRGQTKLYTGLLPGLFRGGFASRHAQDTRIVALKRAVDDIAGRIRLMASFGRYAYEPLLQHYGFRTSWIDLVDNVWVALWFACREAHATGELGQYLHFERRKDVNSFAYILLIAVDIAENFASKPGLSKGPTTECVDLRIACPSLFLRPHAQHGVLFRMRGDRLRRPLDYSSEICGIIRIPLAEAQSWLGDGTTLGTHALFPPPFYDFGYRFFINSKFQGNKIVGAFHHIGT
ncbi:MAG TPA: FRG domain-containing protein [Rhodopseudomonas sp.]|uniref:FRG domain-containing protein n=1 Tax=Rhodopseudomonas sp. TaxID=1078 RepID=UPI002EDB95C2